MRTLRLTSPEMHGDDVRRMQKAMAKHGWLHGEVDGQYGEVSAQGAYRSKYWLGYQTPDHVAGPLLLSYLEGTRPPTSAMLMTAKRRLAAKPKVPLRQKALNDLSRHVGEKESPAGSNRIPYGSGWYGFVGPWCAMAVTHAYVNAGSRAFVRGKRYSYVPDIVMAARQGRGGFALTRYPNPGDIVAFDWNKDGRGDHVGLFVKWLDVKHTTFESVEGNTSATSSGSQSNGGMIARKRRYRTNVQYFIHCAV